MDNNATIGFSFQKLICDKYNIIPNTEQAINQFQASYNKSMKDEIDPVISEIFNALNLKPVEFTTFSVDEHNKVLPYNFILSDNSTLSIRTNISGSKVAPRIVGQAGFEKLNKYFGNIYGAPILSQDDIKHLIVEKVDKCLPIFFDFLFDADYILWIYFEAGKYKYHLIKGDSGVDIKFERDKFSFTRNYDEYIYWHVGKNYSIEEAEWDIEANNKYSYKKLKRAYAYNFKNQVLLDAPIKIKIINKTGNWIEFDENETIKPFKQLKLF